MVEVVELAVVGVVRVVVVVVVVVVVDVIFAVADDDDDVDEEEGKDEGGRCGLRASTTVRRVWRGSSGSQLSIQWGVGLKAPGCDMAAGLNFCLAVWLPRLVVLL